MFHLCLSRRYLISNQLWRVKPFRRNFTTFSIHPSLILQKHFLTYFNPVNHLMASIITTTLLFYTEQILSPAIWCMFALMQIAFVNTVSNVSLPKGCSLLFPSISNKIYILDIDWQNRLSIIYNEKWRKFCWSIFANPICK